MHKLVIFLFLGTFLYGAYPKIYAVLGDTVYENVHKISSLQNLNAYKELKYEIQEYEKEVARVKLKGFEAEHSNNSELAKSYLLDLRKLSQRSEKYLQSAKNNYKFSLLRKDNELFMGIVNSGIINIKEAKEEILQYCYQNLKDENVSGALAAILEEERALQKRKSVKVATQKTKKKLEDEKIKRIRFNDIQARQKLEEKLQEETSKKKQKIRETQKDQLKL